MRRIAITAESVWLFNHADAFGTLPALDWVVARASFGQHMPTDVVYDGEVVGDLIEVGKRFVINTESIGIVTAGRVLAIVNADFPG